MFLIEFYILIILFKTNQFTCEGFVLIENKFYQINARFDEMTNETERWRINGRIYIFGYKQIALILPELIGVFLYSLKSRTRNKIKIISCAEQFCELKSEFEST